MRTQTPVAVPDPDLIAGSLMFQPYEYDQYPAEEPEQQTTQGTEQPDMNPVTEWRWVDEDASPQRSKRGRTYYNAVEDLRRGKRRMYQVGDTVWMGGEDRQTWVAQIIELFQASPKDSELSAFYTPGGNAMRYDLMRCTLRWFYNYPDLNKDSYRVSSAPEWIKDEVFFSDHVEKSGYNDVTVIAGRVWLFGSKEEKDSFLNNPDDEYDPDVDQVKIVRSFVNSNSLLLSMRVLEKDELNFLLNNPATDKNMYDVAPKRMASSH